MKVECPRSGHSTLISGRLYYDPEVGRFISRDPVDIIETAPESSNPYQFVYNNPIINSDPTGLFTIVELNSAQHGQDILQTIQIQTGKAAREYLIDSAKEVVNNAAISALRSYIPFDPSEIWGAVSHLSGKERVIAAGTEFGRRSNRDINSLFQADENFLDYIHLAVPIDKTTGEPRGNGLHIRRWNQPEPYSPGYPRPDFLIKSTTPQDMSKRSLLVGDFKLSVKTMVDEYQQGGRKHNQWLAIVNHARNYGLRTTGFFTIYSGTSVENEHIRRGAYQRGVVAVILSLVSKRGLRSPLP
ncbi:MAG: hypothetical protein F6K30_28805 [Cyanothece sp. SIO2G6]|nr:hypothetical protein [Cyanothece sp. SIO2G6]